MAAAIKTRTSMPYCVRVPFRRAIKSNRLVTDIVIFELKEPDMISSWKVYAFSLATLFAVAYVSLTECSGRLDLSVRGPLPVVQSAS